MRLALTLTAAAVLLAAAAPAAEALAAHKHKAAHKGAKAAAPKPAPTVAVAPAPVIDKAALSASIARSMALLDKAQVRFEKQATCASCHNQVQPMVTAAVLQTKGLAVNQATFKRQQEMAADVIRGRHDYSLSHGFGGGAHIVTATILSGLADVKFPADENTDAAVVYLLAKQKPDGGWPSLATRFPQGETDFEDTLTAVRAIDAYAPPALRAQADAAIAKAQAWTIATPAGTATDGIVKRLKCLTITKAPDREVAKARTLLAQIQKADGGWSQRPGMDSDAYATGDALIALYHAGMKPTDPVYRRGLDFLLKTQAADGSWHVKAHALQIQPPIDAGFPYGPDQWISAWATGYAAEAMAYAL